VAPGSTAIGFGAYLLGRGKGATSETASETALE
jgi:hypothetical protein